MIWSRSRLNFCQSLPGTHVSPWEVFLSIQWTSWNLSKNLKNFCSFRHSNRHQYAFLAWRPDQCKETWLHQCISVEYGMFLTSAHRVELEVHCDDDRWSHLESTRSRHGRQRHLLIVSVEAFPVRLEVLHWNLHSLRFVPALEWVLGIRCLFLTILLCLLQLGITSSHRHQCSNNHLFGSPGTRSKDWSCQYFAVVLGMILPWAHGTSLLVQRDDDKCNSLRWTKNRFRLHCQWHVRILTFPNSSAINAYPTKIPGKTFVPNR